MSWDLVSDIGGTNMRVAQVEAGEILFRRDFPMTKGRDIAATLAEVAHDLGGAPGQVIAAGAGPVEQGALTLTNGGWVVSETDIAAATGARTVRVINDFEAAAWSLATLTDADVRAIGASGPMQMGHRAAVGPGTGLGVGSLIWDGNSFSAAPGEGGHVGVGPRNTREVSIFQRLAKIWPEACIDGTFTVEAEALLSGTGLPKLYEACDGASETPAEDIFARAQQGEAAAVLCRSIFKSHLGAVSGNLAVTLNATGGIFLVGGVAQRNPDLFDDVFWHAFHAGGRDKFTKLRASCGVYLVTVTDFGLRGCINALGGRH